MLLKSPGQSFHRKSLNFGLSSVFSQLNSCVALGMDITEVMVCPQSASHQGTHEPASFLMVA